MRNPIKNRYDFVMLYECAGGNPNGDPDQGNAPRTDLETGHGIVSDCCLKRKIRNYIEAVKEDAAGFRIYIKGGVSLNAKDKEALDYLGVTGDLMTAKKNTPDLDTKIRDFMCENYYDVRTFGAVCTTFSRMQSGAIKGPVQLGFSRSIDPIVMQDITVSRCCITTENDAENKKSTFGHKYIVPYALYRCEGFISANLARKTTGFSEEDVELLWEAIMNMFEHDRAAARGSMVLRELIIFKHDSEMGNAPAHKLFESVKVQRKEDVAVARKYSDYEVSVDADFPGVEVIRKN